MKKMKKMIAGFIFSVIMAVVFSAAAYAETNDVSAVVTGDGRIYLALGVLAGAVVVVVLMLLLKKKSDK